MKADPEIRRQRLARIDELESEVQGLGGRLAAANARLADVGATGRRRFLSWIELVYGLGVVAALVASFYLQLSPALWIIVLCIVVSIMVGVHLLIIKSRLKKLERSA